MNKGLIKVILASCLFFLNSPIQTRAPIENREADEAAAFFESALQQETKEIKKIDGAAQYLTPHKEKRSNLEKKALAWLVWCAVKGESALQSISSLKDRFLAWIWNETRNT